MIIARNRSIVTCVADQGTGRRLSVTVSATRAAWPNVQDLVAISVGKQLAVQVPEALGELPPPGQPLEIEGSIEPSGEGAPAVVFVAARIEKR